MSVERYTEIFYRCFHTKWGIKNFAEKTHWVLRRMKSDRMYFENYKGDTIVASKEGGMWFARIINYGRNGSIFPEQSRYLDGEIA